MRFAGWLAVLVAAVGLGCQSSSMTAAKLYIKQEQPQKAQEQLALVLQTEPENSEAHLLMGKLLGEEGRYGEMAEHLAHAESNPKFQAEAEQTRRHFWAREYNAGVVHAQGEVPNYGDGAALVSQCHPHRRKCARRLAQPRVCLLPDRQHGCGHCHLPEDRVCGSRRRECLFQPRGRFT